MLPLLSLAQRDAVVSAARQARDGCTKALEEADKSQPPDLAEP